MRFRMIDNFVLYEFDFSTRGFVYIHTSNCQSGYRTIDYDYILWDKNDYKYFSNKAMKYAERVLHGLMY